MRVDLIIPAFDEEEAIGAVVRGFGARRGKEAFELFEIVVADNNSADATADRAQQAGAVVVHEPRPGYGSACLRAIRYLRERPDRPEVVVFADGDGSNDPADLGALVAPLLRQDAELVIGSRRRLGTSGAMTLPQRFGNALATRMMRTLLALEYSDLGPYRAIRWEALERLGMCDPDFGWTVEMQIKAGRAGLRVREVDVRNHPRIAGRSKVSGTVRGVIGAGRKIVGTILKYR